MKYKRCIDCYHCDDVAVVGNGKCSKYNKPILKLGSPMKDNCFVDKNSVENFKFKAIPSGDYEAFTFAVSKDDYIKIKCELPNGADENDFIDNKYNIYPNDFFNLLDTNCKEFEIEINIKEI